MSSIVPVIKQHSFFGFQRPVEWILIGVAAVVNSALWAAASLMIQQQNQLTPIHYTIYFGIDLTGPGWHLYYLPGFGAVIWLSHLFGSRAVNHPVWRQSWLILAVAFQILLGAVLAGIAYVRLQS